MRNWEAILFVIPAADIRDMWRSGRLDQQTYVDLAYRYAREIEHSDWNLNTLEELFMKE